jgi:hypothetical protein
MNHPTRLPGRRDPRDEVAGEQRSTFFAVRDVLKHGTNVLRAVRLHLQALRPRDERMRLFTSALINRRSKLEYAIGQCVQAAAPSGVLDTFVQYASDANQTRPATPAQHGDADALVRWQNDTDEKLVQILGELAQRVRKPAAAEIFRAIADLLVAHDQDVARKVQELRDI